MIDKETELKNWILNDVRGACKKLKCEPSELKCTPDKLSTIIDMMYMGLITRTNAKSLFELICNGAEGFPPDVAYENGLLSVKKFKDL